MNLDILFKGGRVKRYHTEAVIGHQSVAEHSWGVVLLIERLWPECSKNLLLAALHHDTHEATMGDIPAPTKRMLRKSTVALDVMEEAFDSENNILYHLTPTERLQLKIADYLELVLFCRHQYKMGNGMLLHVEQKGIEYIEAVFGKNPTLVDTLNADTVGDILDIFTLKETT